MVLDLIHMNNSHNLELDPVEIFGVNMSSYAKIDNRKKKYFNSL